MTSRLARIALVGLMVLASPGLVLAQDGQTDVPATFGLNGIGGQLGFLDPDGIGSTFGFGGHANLGPLVGSVPNLLFVPNLFFWSVDDFTEFAIQAEVQYVVPTEGGLLFFFGGGLGLYFLSFSTEFFDLSGERQKISDNSTDIGLTLLGGVSKDIAPNVDIFGMLRLKFGEADTWGLLGGVTFEITH